ncbi:CAP domain-containing protein [Fictibacillus sp. WQ 8-8]|uniref:CAP domain-containing protein n=1 Tax=Fictibacillus sp. WQ 8-8 TaxID=2938788 RepID=UPI00210AC380|nr:CAP domain-containing protein [Fictibacillus sp. WQ 8-8]MCQ6267316.1 CAP domain-containing protein [Fictibacillus sp. WQ 8-8]
MRKAISIPMAFLCILVFSSGCNNMKKNELGQDQQHKRMANKNMMKTGNGYLTKEKIPYQSKAGRKKEMVQRENISYNNPDMSMETNPDINGTVPPAAPPSGNQGYSQEMIQRVVELTNQERRKYGLSDLKWDPSLTNVAQVKANDMEKNNYFSHNSPTYGSPFEQMDKMDIPYSSAGENIAVGQQSPEQVVNDWMNSEGHRKNILNPDYTHIGIGYTDNEDFWAQEFIKK